MNRAIVVFLFMFGFLYATGAFMFLDLFWLFDNIGSWRPDQRLICWYAIAFLPTSTAFMVWWLSE